MRRPSLSALLLPAALLAAPVGAQVTPTPTPAAPSPAAASPAAAPAAAPTPTTPAPEVGQPAPDFTAAWADTSGPRATPVKLSEQRGKVVVLAFYPKDRSSGCTAELTRFRDEHASLFGPDVVVLPISVDDVDTHASWAKEMRFPFALVSDTSLAVAEQYGSRMTGRSTSSRTVFVIGKDGTVAWRELRFNALAENAYTALAAAVKQARGAE
jgi:thioredoxin-dependent peroxiredoxin